MFAQLSDLKTFLNLGDVTSVENSLDMCLKAAASFMDTYCDHKLEYSFHSRYLTPVNPSILVVPDYPLVQVAGITVFSFLSDTRGTACDLTQVKWSRSGQVYSGGLFTSSFPNCILIDYYAGFTENDPEWETLKWLQLEISAELFRGRGTLHIQTYQSGGAQISRFSDFASLLSPEVFITLNMFCTRGPRLDYS